MGGNAIKQFGEGVRLSATDYDELALEILSILSTPNITPRLIPSYHNKPDHGDMDIIVPCMFNFFFSYEEVKEKLNAVGYVRNGPVTSYAIPYNKQLFQIDIIYIQDDTFDFADKYYSYNDLGNLLGRVAHRMGFKLGHQGLTYILRDHELPTHVISEITITTDWEEAIEFLGYSADRYHQGFDDLIDIFQYTMSSPFAKREIYLLENRNATSRIRDRKRKTYMDFLDWLESTTVDDLIPTTIDKKIEFKSVHVLRAMDVFPKFVWDIEVELDEYKKEKHIKKIINGKLINELTGLSGKELGQFISIVRAIKSTEMIYVMPPEEVTRMIMDLYCDIHSGTLHV